LFFQLIAAVARDDTIATAFGSFFILIFVNLSGFVIITSDIPGWWQEGFWPQPFSWAMRALVGWGTWYLLLRLRLLLLLRLLF